MPPSRATLWISRGREIEHQSLRALLSRGPLEPTRASAIFLQLAQVIAARGLLHGELRAEDVIVTGDGVKLRDAPPPRTLPGDAPPPPPAKGDVYGLGAILLEMLGGPDAAPPALLSIAQRCMQRDPHARFASAHEVAAALESRADTPSAEGGGGAISGGLGERYRFLAPLATGGMGRVSIVEDKALRREVAVKELLGDAGPRAVARFEREALLTARLQHPGIVSVYEVGRKPSGEPYLILRRVRGEPLDAVMERATTLPARLALLQSFVSIVETLAYAHDQGVIHRDLKPQNVLLGEFGDTVVIDWGLAKDLRAPLDLEPAGDEKAEGTGELTTAGAVLGTPMYMSPEQARGEAADARSDVYALGAMLYRLLSGAPPHKGPNSEEVLDAVRTREPAPLRKLVPELAPELATIVAHAMARELRDRYASAKALAEDLKSFLAGRLVRSHSYSAGDLFARWARRNALVLSVAAGAVVLLAIAGVAAFNRVVRERDRANREAHTAGEVASFLTGLFKAASPAVAQGKTVTARDLLDQGVARIDALSGQPQTQAQLLTVMGDSYRNLGVYSEGQRLLERALELRRKELGPDAPESIDAEMTLIANLLSAGKWTEVLSLSRDALERTRRMRGPESRSALLAADDVALAESYLGHVREAIELRKPVLEVERRVLEPSDQLLAVSLSRMAADYSGLGEYALAAPLQREAVEVRRSGLGPDHPQTLTATAGLADLLCHLGLAEGEALHAKVLADEQRVLGEKHPYIVYEIWSGACCRMYQKKWAEAEPLARKAIALGDETHALPPEQLARQARLAYVVAMQGRAQEAAAMSQEIQRRLDALAPDANTGFAQVYLARVAVIGGDVALELRLLRAAVAGGNGDLVGVNVRDDDEFAPLRSQPEFARLIEKSAR